MLQPILVRPGRLAIRADRRRATVARIAPGAARHDPGHRRRVRRRDRARGLDHREPAARGRLAARGGGDVPQDDRPRLFGPSAGAEDRQGQGLRREPDAPGRCAARDSRAGVRAQRHDQPRLRADEDRRRADPAAAGEEGRRRRADAGPAAGHHRQRPEGRRAGGADSRRRGADRGRRGGGRQGGACTRTTR